MIELLKVIGPPGSPGFAVAGACVAFCLARVWPRRSAVTLAWVTALVIGYLALALPAVSFALARPLSISKPHQGTLAVDTVFVLGGDNYRGRIREARRIYDAHPHAAFIALGERWFVERLVEAGIPRERLRMVAEPGTTREQLEWVRGHVGSQPHSSSALIASRIHMARVGALVDAMGIDTMLFSAPLDAEPPGKGPWRWVPNLAALRMSREVLYERTALVYYESRRWIRARTGGEKD